VCEERERRRSAQSFTFFAAEAAAPRADGRRARFASKTAGSKKTGLAGPGPRDREHLRPAVGKVGGLPTQLEVQHLVPRAAVQKDSDNATHAAARSPSRYWAAWLLEERRDMGPF
jgi:hypothetical protein